MPDGEIAICYAKAIAEGIAQAHYPGGFEALQFNLKELDAIRRHKTAAGIFIDSMSDLLGLGVPDSWIEQVIAVMTECPHHIFFILTKNPPRLSWFEWPQNAWLGVSAPPSFMFGQRLSADQQRRWYDRALECLSTMKAGIRWTSVEPLSWDVAGIVAEYALDIDWLVIGAASRGRQYYQPDPHHLLSLLKVCRINHIPVFFKGNLRPLIRQLGLAWREEFPAGMERGSQDEVIQMPLL
jgi:protein gp37